MYGSLWLFLDRWLHAYSSSEGTGLAIEMRGEAYACPSSRWRISPVENSHTCDTGTALSGGPVFLKLSSSFLRLWMHLRLALHRQPHWLPSSHRQAAATVCPAATSPIDGWPRGRSNRQIPPCPLFFFSALHFSLNQSTTPARSPRLARCPLFSGHWAVGTSDDGHSSASVPLLSRTTVHASSPLGPCSPGQIRAATSSSVNHGHCAPVPPPLPPHPTHRRPFLSSSFLHSY